MIAIAFPCGRVHPGLTSWVILSRPYGTDLGGEPYPGLPRISCTLLWTPLRMRLSSRKAARGSVTPPSFTGNPVRPGLFSAVPPGLNLVRVVVTQTLPGWADI
jgi:hypothetical protein